MAKRGRICSKSLARVIVMLLVMSMCLSGCNNNASTQPGKESTTQQSGEATQPSGEGSTDSSKEDATDNKDESQEDVKEESSESTSEEQTEISGDYLKEVAETENLEIKLSDYNSDYKIGDTVTITMELECEGAFNGSLGTCVGTDYAWKQSDFEAEAGTYTLSWKVKPSVDMAQLGIWYASGSKVGVKSIDVTIEEPEIGIKGNFLKVLQAGDNWELKLSDYNSAYVVGDYVNLEITFESDGDFNGAVGACIGKDYAWNQQEYAYDEAGTYTFSWKFKPSTDMAQIGVWWVGGTAVGVKDIKVTVEEQPIGITGDYKAIFTDQGFYEFSPYGINNSFKFGDTLKITVELESDGAFNGCMATCVGDNYAWEQTEMSSEAGTSTWTLTVAPSADLIQIAFWWIDGSAVGIKDIDVEIVKYGRGHVNVVGEITTVTKDDSDFTFKPSDYCEFEDGDIITITVVLDSNKAYNGCLAATDINGVYRKATYEAGKNGGTVICSLSLEASNANDATIQYWWMENKVAVNDIKVTLGGTVEEIEPGVWLAKGEQLFPLSDFVDYSEGDTLEITAVLSSNGSFNGALGATHNPGVWDWKQADFNSDGTNKATCTMTLPNATIGNLMIGIWDMQGTEVKLDSLTVKVTEKAAGSDDGEGETTTPSEPEVDTEAAYSGSVTFSDTAYWTSVSYGTEGSGSTYSFDEIIGDVAPADITAIKFSSNTAFIIGYNNNSGDFPVDASDADANPYWSQYSGEKSYTIANAVVMDFTKPDGEVSNPYIMLALSKGDGKDYTISWNVYTGEVPEEEEPEGDGIIYIDKDDDTYKVENADGSTTYTVSLDPADYCEGYASGDDISIEVDLYSDDYFNGIIGMNGPSWDSTSQLESSGGEVTTWEYDVTDSNGNIQIQIWWMNSDSVEIREVRVTKAGADDGTTDDGTTEDDGADEEDTVVWGENCVTFSDSAWWTYVNVSLADLIGDTAVADIESITFTGTTDFTLGYNNTTGDSEITENNDNPFWTQVSGATTYTVSNISLETFADDAGGVHEYGLMLALSKHDGVDYTISWTVNEKASEDDETVSGGDAGDDGDGTVSGGDAGDDGDGIDDDESKVITVWEGSSTIASWSESLSIPATGTENVAFDGTQKLVITYESTDKTVWATQFKLWTGDWAKVIREVNVNISGETTMEILLTSDLSAVGTNGVVVQGYNWTITKAEVMPADGSADKYSRTTAWSGEKAMGTSYANNIPVEASALAGLEFDGTEKLIITYKTEDKTNYTYNTIYFNDANWSNISLGYNVFMMSDSEIEVEIILDKDCSAGLNIGGYNVIITKVEIVTPNN